MSSELDDTKVDLLAERSVLGAMLLHPEAVDEVSFLQPEDFSLRRHQLVFQAVRAAHVQYALTDPITVEEQLTHSGYLHEVGGRDILLDLMESVVSPAGISHHAELVRKAAAVRRLRQVARNVLHQDGRDPADQLYEFRRALDAIPQPACERDPLKAAGIRLVDELRDLPSTKYLIDGLLPESGLVVLCGAPGTGKTFALLDWLFHLTTGRPWHGRPTTACSALLLPGEGQAGLAARVRAWQEYFGEPVAHGQYFAVGRSLPLLTSTDGQRELRAIISALRDQHGHAPQVVAVDTWSVACGGAEDGNSQDSGPALRCLTELRDEFGCGFVVLHHPRKRPLGFSGRLSLDDLRGSSSLAGSADVVLALTGRPEALSLYDLKRKDNARAEDIHLRLRTVGGSWGTSCVIAPGSPQAMEPDRAELVLRALQACSPEGLTRAQVAQSCDLGLTTAGEVLQRLVGTDKAHSRRESAGRFRYWAGPAPQVSGQVSPGVAPQLGETCPVAQVSGVAPSLEGRHPTASWAGTTQPSPAGSNGTGGLHG